MVDEKLIERLRELLAKATPLPWFFCHHTVPFARTISTAPVGAPGDVLFEDAMCSDEDMELVVSAVNALPQLLSALDAQREELCAYNRFIEQIYVEPLLKWGSTLAEADLPSVEGDPPSGFDHAAAMKELIRRAKAYVEQRAEIGRLREERDGYMFDSHNRPGDGLSYSESDACHCETCERVRRQLAERTPADWKRALEQGGKADAS